MIEMEVKDKTSGWNSLISEIFGLIGDIWKKGNQKSRGMMIGFILYLATWFFTTFAFASSGMKNAVVVMAFIAIIVVLTMFIMEPIILSLVVTTKATRKIRTFFGFIILGQLVLSIYMYFIPIHNWPILFLMQVVIIATIILLSGVIEPHKKTKTYRWIMRVLTWFAFGCTAIFLLGGQQPATNAVNKTVQKGQEIVERVGDIQINMAPQKTVHQVKDTDGRYTLTTKSKNLRDFSIFSEADFVFVFDDGSESQTFKGGQIHRLYSKGPDNTDLDIDIRIVEAGTSQVTLIMY